MTHDPFQTYATLGTIPGVTAPFQTPYAAAVNPQLAQNPLLAQQAYAGIPQAGMVSPQQLQLAQILQAVLPQLLALSQIAAPWQNPQLAASLQQQSPYPQQHPQIGYAGSPFGGSPFGPTAPQLAPQTWVGQGIPYGGFRAGF